MAAIQSTGFTVSMDGVADSGIYFIWHDMSEIMTATTMDNGISYNPTTNRVNKSQEVEISNIQILEYEETDVNHVDYNKIPVTVKSYFVDFRDPMGYEANYKGTEEYTALNVALEDLVAPSLDGETARYGANAFVIFGDVSADGKIYNSFEEFEAEISDMTYGTVYLNRNKQITGHNQGTLTCYDMSSEEFTAAALGKTITICTLPLEG